MSSHARLSPSSRHRWANCPGSVREEAKYPEGLPGPSAVDGTRTHLVLEHCIDNSLLDPHTLENQAFKAEGNTFVVDKDRADRVAVAIDYIKQRSNNGELQVISEERVDPAELLGRSDMGGTIDCQIIGNDWIEIIDYKDGMIKVEADGNLQIEQYAYGVIAKYGASRFNKIIFTVIQPKLSFKKESAISSFEYDVESLLSKRDVIISQALATDDLNAPLIPGDKQCKFCKAKGGCSALSEKVMGEVGIMFGPVKNNGFDIVEQSAEKDPSVMTDEQLKQIMEAAPLMRQLLDGVEQEALRRLESGKNIQGLKLVYGRGSRTWALPEEEMAEKLLKMGIPKTAIYETKLVSPAKAEKMTWEKRDGTKMSLSDRQLKRLDQEYVTKLSGKLTVVSESDSRPAVIKNAAPLFGAVGAVKTVEPLPLPSWLINLE